MNHHSLNSDYKKALTAFVEAGSEAKLAQAYQIGREALMSGLTLGELGELHHEAARELLASQKNVFASLFRSEEFFVELASVYDMALRGYRESIARLQTEIDERRIMAEELRVTSAELAQQRDLLEQRVEERTQALKAQANVLQKANLELQRSNRALDDFAHIASHDLKEPLRAIYNHASFLLEDYQEKLGDDGKNRLNRLIVLSRRIEHLISDLLRFSRLGRGQDAMETLNLKSLITDVETALADTLEARNARIALVTDLPEVTGNRAQITTLFQNLVSNATKYNESAEKIVEIGKADMEPEEGDNSVVLFVRDNGIGIDPQFNDEIFRLFKRLHSDKAYGGGTGAGLTFVRKIVENHGGRIWLTSTPGAGTTFYFTLKNVA